MAEINTNISLNDAGSIKKKGEYKDFLLNNIVTIIFIVISLLAFIASKQPLFFVLSQLLERISRNTFLVLALIVPVMAGMGLNFSIVIGAMAGQMAIIIATNYGLSGFPGFLAAALISIPFAIIFGIMTGRLLNKTRGQEMIASMIVGFFANGVYQFIFLFLVGAVIPLSNTKMLLRSGIGLRNTIDLDGGLKYSVDGVLGGALKLPFFSIMLFASILTLAYMGYKLFKGKANDLKLTTKERIGFVSSIVVAVISFSIMYFDFLPSSVRMLKNLKFPLLTGLFIAMLCVFNIVITKTKLGQDFRSVGQSQHIAKVSGIHVDKTRVIAITISTVLAAWGQIIFLQNIGVLNTFGSHMQIGLFSVAALLVGGASVSRATVGQAILGVILFHTLFIVSPYAGKELFGDPQIGEFFRAFVAYGVIGLSLGLYAWKKAFGTES